MNWQIFPIIKARLFMGILIPILSLAQPSQTAHFNQGQEFPNLFLPEKYRSLPPEQIPAGIVTQTRTRVEEAMASIFKRLTIPVSFMKDGAMTTKVVNYIPYLESALRKIDPGVKVMPSAGVVRSALGYIYNEMHREFPSKSPDSVLQSIIDAKQDIPAHEIRGIGSDFDILISGHRPEKFNELQQLALKITSSAGEALGMAETAPKLKQVIFTVGDVQDYAKQIAEATGQGGSALDFLAFDPELGKIVEPENVKGIVNDFIKGTFSYIEGSSQEAKQTVRGMRPFLELPFLHLKDEATFRQQLEGLLASLKKEGLNPNKLEKAREQFDKMIRNARFEGAHNRFYRAKPGSIDSLILQVSQEFERATGKATIPEFGDRFSLSARGMDKQELNGLPKELLTDIDDFIRTHTKDGVLFHGVSSIDNGIGILRGGLFISKDGAKLQSNKSSSVALFGRGIYTTPSKAMAQEYAGDGVVFDLKTKSDKRVNVLTWNDKIKEQPFIKSLLTRTQGNLDEAFAILAKEHGIDIIVNGHVLIQNVDAVENPKGVKGIIRANLLDEDRLLAENLRVSPLERVQAFNKYESWYNYAVALGERDLPPPLKITRKQFTQQYLPMLTKPEATQRIRGLEVMASLQPSDVKVQKAMLQLLNDPDQKVRKAVLTAFGEFYSEIKDPLIQTKVVEQLAASDLSNSAHRLVVAWNGELKPDAIQKLTQMLSAESPEIQRRILNMLSQLSLDDPELLFKIATLASSSDPIISRSATGSLKTQELNLPLLRTKFQNLMRDPSDLVRSEALTAMRSIEGTHLEYQLSAIKALADPNPLTRKAAAEALMDLAPLDPGVRTSLLGLFTQSNPEIRANAMFVAKLGDWLDLGTLSPSRSKELKVKVGESLHHELPSIRKKAIQSLKDMARTDSSLQLKIADALIDSNPEVRTVALEAMKSLRPSDSSLQVHLLELLSTKTPPTDWAQRREVIIQSLGYLNDPSPKVALKLLEIMEDPREYGSINQMAMESFKSLAPSNLETLEKLDEIAAKRAGEIHKPDVHRKILQLRTELKSLSASKPTCALEILNGIMGPPAITPRK